MQRDVDDRLVAVKVMDAVEQRLLLKGQDDLNPLWRETRFSQTVRHPAIVRVFTTGRLPDGRYYVAMEFVDGPTLEQDLQHRGPMETPDMLELVSQIGGAVACLHEKRIIHRDLKPGNLILRAMGDGRVRVKLIDFGQAKLAHHRDDWASLGGEEMFGTPRYMAPEQARGEGSDYSSDVYAIGAIAYELITGKPALALKRATAETCLAYLRSDHPLPALPIARTCPSIDPDVAALIESCLSRAPGERPRDASVFKAHIDGFMEDPAVGSVGPLKRVWQSLWSRED